VRRFLLLLIASTGCDRVFYAQTQPLPDAVGAVDRCAPIAPDPLRYTAIPNPGTWDAARAACAQRGMDLAVINDEHELADADIEIRPYWIGQAVMSGGWNTIDGCPAYAPPPAFAANQCGVIGDDPAASVGTGCDGSMPVVAALCETPRPTSAACTPAHPGAETYVTSPSTLSFADAQAYCSGQHAHLAVIDSFAELTHISQLASEGSFQTFWIGSQFADNAWTTETGCPGLYSWTNFGPTISDATACASGTMVDGSFGGTTASSCGTDQFIALCELE
jgi:hypothetical protein